MTERAKENKFSTPIKLAAHMAEPYLKILEDPSDEEYSSAFGDLTELIQSVTNQSEMIGDPNDFHNFAVDLAKKDFNHLACDIIRCGLKQYPRNCDLLGDFLQYGIDCGLKEECKRYFEALQKIPRRRYTWRGFSFSINYLEALLDDCETDEEIDKLTERMFILADEYLKYFPYEEGAFCSKADIYKALKEPDNERKTLEVGLEQLKVAPKCALRLADLLFERGEYQECMNAIQRGIGDSNQEQASINESYLYYLSALTRIAIAQKAEQKFNENLVMEVFSDFNICLPNIGSRSYKQNIQTKVNMLKSLMGISVPERFENLYYLVEA